MREAPYIVAERLHVTLGGRLVIEDISFSLPRGCMAALVGPNGAGKTTLLRALAGLLPTEGTVHVGGDTAASLAARERARRMAYLPQGHEVHWPLPVRDIVALGRYPHGATDPSRLGQHDAEAVDRAMQRTDVSMLGERTVTEISGGERSRTALARVLAVEAPVILADEPIASLDPHYQIQVMTLLRNACEAGAIVLVVTHDLGLAARFSDMVLVLNGGRLVAAGRPEDALAPDILADVFRISAFRAEWEGKPVIVPWTTS